MHQVHLIRSAKSGNAALKALVVELQKIRNERGHVLRTHVHVDDKEYELVTTSKDLHLVLGKMSKRNQDFLCLLLEDEYSKAGASELILFENEERGGVYVSMNRRPGGVIVFQLAPTR